MNNILNQLTGFKDRLLAPYNGLKVTWFDGWRPSLAEALEQLPEMETCPHELFSLLLQNSESAPKKIALVTAYGTPVAIIPLKRLGRWRYEVATWMIPSALFPAKPDFLASALEALGVDIWVAWRRMGGPPPDSPLIRSMRITPVHILNCSGNYEDYWREIGRIRNVRRARNRCKGFETVVNTHGSAEWVIRNAAMKWSREPLRTSRVVEDWVISDWIMTANYWEERGRHFTILLLDHGSPIGGATLMVHKNDAVGGMIYHKPEYAWYSVGTRLLDLSVSFAAEQGYDVLDFGGDAEYKKYWAPQVSKLWHFSLCPEPLFLLKRAFYLTRNVRGQIFNIGRSR